MNTEKVITIVEGKFQDFRKEVLKNLGIVLKIVFGNKYLIHTFDKNKFADYEPKHVTKEEYMENMIESELHNIYNIMTKGHVTVQTCAGIEKRHLADEYRVHTIEKEKNTQIKTKKGEEKMIRLTKKDLMEQIRIMRMDLTDGTIDKAVDNCGTYNRVNKDIIYFWGIEEEVCDYELKLKKCTLLKTPAFKKEVAKYLENDFDIRGVRIVVSGVFGTAEVLVDVEDVVTGKLVEVRYLWDNKCNYSKYKELERRYPDAEKKFKQKEDAEKARKALEEKKEEPLAKELVVNNLGVEPEKKSRFEVRIVEIETGKVVETLNASNLRVAKILERRALLKINREDYYVETVDLTQLKNIEEVTPEEVLEVAEKLGMPSLEEEVSPEPTPEDVTEWQGLEKNKTYTNKSEEKEMNTINKNALNNRMVKLGEFLKENTDKQEIENKVFELFPKAMEVEVFNNDNVVYFLVGQDYAGKAPTKKEMKEKDYLFDSIDRMYGLSVYVSVDDDKIKMESSIGVDYSDKYGHSHYTDCTVKEIEIELEVTMEKAKRKAEYLRELYANGKIRATYGWDKIRELSLRETTDEVLDFLIEELTYYAYEEKKEKEKSNIKHIQYKIEKAHYSFTAGIESVEKILISLKRLYQYCHNDELKKQVDETVALYEKAEDLIWGESVRKQVTELVEKRQKAIVQSKIDKLEKAVTGKVSYEDAREILKELAVYAKKEWKEDTKGYKVVTEPMRSICFGVGNEKNIIGGCEKIICTRGLQYGIEWREKTNTMIIFVEGTVEYMKDGEVVTDEKHCIFKKEINCNPDPEKDELDSIEESEVVTEKPEQTRLDDTSQPKKRKYATIEQYDYVSKEEFEKHRKEMEDAGFRLINGIYDGLMDAGELGGSETWTYTASYIKSDMY